MNLDGDRLVLITAPIAETWGRLNAPDPVPVVDGLMAATALVHDWTLVTRNVDDVRSTGVRLLDPFTEARRPAEGAAWPADQTA
jgi:predicted nucleic acid-binding protein